MFIDTVVLVLVVVLLVSVCRAIWCIDEDNNKSAEALCACLIAGLASIWFRR
jgi:hypothetical protein